VEREATRFAEIVKDLKPTEVTVSQVGDVKPGSARDDQPGGTSARDIGRDALHRSRSNTSMRRILKSVGLQLKPPNMNWATV